MKCWEPPTRNSVIKFRSPINYRCNLKFVFKIIGQLFLLWVVYFVSTWLVTYFHIPLPGSVLGMIILFTLLSTGIIKGEWLIDATAPLLKHLSFFFIPIAVELMEWGDLFLQKGHLLFLPLVISTLVALLTTGGVAQLLMTRQNRKSGEH